MRRKWMRVIYRNADPGNWHLVGIENNLGMQAVCGKGEMFVPGTMAETQECEGYPDFACARCRRIEFRLRQTERKEEISGAGNQS